MANYLFAGGGTGGHITPGFAVAEEIQKLDPGAKVDFACTGRGLDQTVLKNWPGRTIVQPVQPFSSRPMGLVRFVLGMYRTQRIIRRWIAENQIVAVLGLGGFGSSAALQTASKMGLRTAFLNPDFVPGKANQWLSRYSDKIFAQWSGTQQYFNRQIEVVGVPLRQPISEMAGPKRDEFRKQGLAELGLSPELKTLVIMGGSTGARSLNDAVVKVLPGLAKRMQNAWQVVHITGTADRERIAAVYKANPDIKVSVLDYLDRMNLAWAAADLAICRAGAITLAELTAVGLPSILLPYPYHTDNHQAKNANVLVQSGAAILIEDDKVAGPQTTDALHAGLEKLCFDDNARAKMAAGALTLQRVDAARLVAKWMIGS